MTTRDGPAQKLASTLSQGVVIASSLAVVGVLSVLFSVWGALVTDDALGIIRSQMSFTGDRFADLVRTWDIAEFIRLTATLDFIYPVAYATAIAGIWARAAGPDGWTRAPWPLIAAFGAAAADWLENTFHILAIEPAITGGSPVSTAVAVGSTFAAVKWIGIIAAVSGAARTAWIHAGWHWRLIGIVLAGVAGALAGLVVTSTV